MFWGVLKASFVLLFSRSKHQVKVDRIAFTFSPKKNIFYTGLFGERGPVWGRISCVGESQEQAVSKSALVS